MKIISTLLLMAIFAVMFINTDFAQASSGDAKTAAPATDEVKLPDTPAGKTFAAFLQAFNSGDINVMRKFHQERKGNPDNAEQDWGAYKQTGGLKVIKVNKSSDYALEVLVEAKSDARRLNFAIEVDSNAPHGIMSIQAQPAQ
ncbi:MAG: hypothetical protein AB1757_04005 [Acidobacteriota bacterium]